VPPERDGSRVENQIDRGTALDRIDVSRRVRWFLANGLIALGWGLKGSCKPCAHRLFTSARWLVPEAQRFYIQRTISHNRNRRTFDFAVALPTLLRGIPPHLVTGLLIVLALLGSLDLATRTRKVDTQPLVENSSIPHEPQIQSESKGVSVSKSLEPMQEFVLETASLPGAQIAPIPLPLKKPAAVYKVPNRKGAKGIANAQKTLAHQKTARQKR
jgi:hypothetical protein